MAAVRVSAISGLTLASAMPIPVSGCLRANLRRLPNMYQLSLANSYSKLVLPDTSM